MVAINLKERFKNGELDLSSTGLKEIPIKEIISLKHVTSLNLSNNKISSVGRGIGNLSHLSKLDLSRNHIKGIPENIGNLINLKHLNLSHNQISTLPATIGNLKSLKYLDIKNNQLAQKFSEIIGSCQNENQCQQAAKNIIKAFSSQQSDSDKKKKQKDSEQELKKKKTDKKTQNGGINNQTKQKERKQKKSDTGIFGKIVETIFILLRTILISILITGIAVYILSLYDENRYKAIKAQIFPVWHSTITRVMSEESASKLETALEHAGKILHETIINCCKFITELLKRFYTYVSTDDTIQGYVNNTRVVLHDMWSKLTSRGGEQKS